MSYQRDARAQPSQVGAPQYGSATPSRGGSAGHAAPGVRPVPNESSCDCDLLLWKNPIETGKVFGLSLVGLLILKKVNLITFFLRVLYTVVFTTGAIEFASKFVLGQGLVSRYGLKQCPNVVGYLRPRMESFLQQLPVFQSKLRELVFAYEPKRNFKAGVAFYFLHKFFSWFSVWTILFLGVISAFTLPIVYHTHQQEIDEAVCQGVKVARAKSAEVSQMVSEKSRPCVEKLDEKLGPVSKFVKAQYANAYRASAGAQTTSSAAPHATTAELAAKVPLEPQHGQDAYVSGHAPSSTSASSRGAAAAAAARGAAAAAESSHSFNPYSSLNPQHTDFSEQAKAVRDFPDVPVSDPLSGVADDEFSVDQLQSDLKQNKDALSHELDFNKH